MTSPQTASRRFGTLVLAVLSAIVTLAPSRVGAEGEPGRWTQWGGPDQEFRAPAGKLARQWPADGPRTLWKRDLGEGYSAILFDGGRLYTMYRPDAEREAVVSLNAATGETLWERSYAARPADGHVTQFGEGPRATPLIVGERLFTIGVSGVMHCLDKRDGKVLWSHDLWKEFGGNTLQHGYSSSPIEYKGTVIALVGGEGHAIVAFDRKDGSVAWQSLDFDNSYSTPRILNVHGRDQLVTFMAEELIGVDPRNGKLLWRYPHTNQWKQNISMPVLVDGRYLFLSSPEAGARGLKLTNEGETTEIEELWSTRKIQFYHVSTVRDGDWVYGSTGTMAPAFMAAINVKTGEIGWRKRGFAKANCLLADGRLLILDEDGNLTLATATPEDLTVHSRVRLTEKVSWTVPTVVGQTMYVRDKASILAVDLS